MHTSIRYTGKSFNKVFMIEYTTGIIMRYTDYLIGSAAEFLKKYT